MKKTGQKLLMPASTPSWIPGSSLVLFFKNREELFTKPIWEITVNQTKKQNKAKIIKKMANIITMETGSVLNKLIKLKKALPLRIPVSLMDCKLFTNL